LGACGTAPALMMNQQYYEGLDIAKLDALLESLE